MDKRVFMALIYFAALVMVLSLVFKLLSPFLTPMAWAAVIAMATHPLHRWYLKLLRGRNTLASLVSTMTIVLVVVVPITVMAVLFAGQAVSVYEFLQKTMASGTLPAKEQLLANPLVQKSLLKLQPVVGEIDLKPLILSAMNGASTIAVGASKAILINTLAAIVKFFVMVALLFFFFRDGQTLIKGFWEMVPLKEADKSILAATVDRVVNAVMYGIVLTCILQGILGGIGLAIAGVPSSVFFGAVMIVCAFIPLVGTAIVWIPAAVFLMATGQTGKGVFLVAWCVLVVSSIDNIVRPYFISGKAKIPLLVILLGVLGGLAAMGFLGIIVGPLLFAVSLELAKVYKTEIFSQFKGGTAAEG